MVNYVLKKYKVHSPSHLPLMWKHAFADSDKFLYVSGNACM